MGLRHLATIAFLAAVACGAAAPWWWVGGAIVHWGMHLIAGGVVLLVLARRQRLVAGVVLVGILVTAWPWLVESWSPRARLAADGAGLTMATVNIGWWNDRDAEAVAADLLALPAEVLVLIEIPARVLERITARLGEDRVLAALPGMRSYRNVAIACRQEPLESRVIFDPEDGSPILSVTIATADGPLAVLAVHPKAPISGPSLKAWRATLDALAEHVASSPVPVVALGDFNSTPGHPQWRRLRHAGLRPAPGPAGPTWPRTWGPAGLPLDRILVGPGLASGVPRTVVLPGSDHLGLVVDVAREDHG